MKNAFWQNIFKEPHLQSSQLNSSFQINPNTSFQNYIDHTRNIIKQGRIDLTSENSNLILSANLPFSWQVNEVNTSYLNSVQHSQQELNKNKSPFNQKSRGVLLIHGLGDTPYWMRALARIYHQEGFLVRSVLLPGHGTRPGDLLLTNYEAWQQNISYALFRLSKKVDEVHLVGFSTGATLAVDAAVKYILGQSTVAIASLLLLAPALGLTPLLPLASTLRWAKPWLAVYDEGDYAKYESFSLASAYQVYLLLAQLKQSITDFKLSIPTFLVWSDDDNTIAPKDMAWFIANYFNLDYVQGICYQSSVVQAALKKKRFRPSFTTEYCPADLAKMITLVDSYIPEKKILSGSHLSLLLPDDDPHYGIAGDYQNYLAYGCRNNSSAYSHRPHWRGEVTSQFLNQFNLMRLTYNPYFHNMAADIRKFLGTV